MPAPLSEAQSAWCRVVAIQVVADAMEDHRSDVERIAEVVRRRAPKMARRSAMMNNWIEGNEPLARALEVEAALHAESMVDSIILASDLVNRTEGDTTCPPR